MSRLTGTDAHGLMEAYTAVYAPQELTEEQIWEEVESWVNSLLEEGYDLSDYTWEEMYESYIEEQGGVKPSVSRLRAGGPGRDESPKPAPSMSYTQRMDMRREVRNRGRIGGYKSPQSSTPAPSAPTRPTPAPSAPTRPTPAPSAPIRPTPAAPAPRSTTPPARPAAAPAGGTTRPKPTATTTPPPAPSTPRAKDTSITDMIGRSQVRQGAPINTGSSTSDARAIAARSSVGATPKPAPSTATAKPTPRQARLNMEMEYDTFDTVLEYLVAEGYADTNEAALVIMANMSEEWKQSIVTA